MEGELGEIVEEIDEDAQHDVDVRADDTVAEPPVPDHDDGSDGVLGGEGVAGGSDPYAGIDWPDPDEPPVPDPGGSEPSRPVAFIPGYGVIPPALLADLIARGTRIRPIDIPGPDADPGYRPGAATARFVRHRDLTCRAPGCDQRAAFTDIDHTIPYPAGPTHAGQLKCDCRKHSLLSDIHLCHDQHRQNRHLPAYFQRHHRPTARRRPSADRLSRSM